MSFVDIGWWTHILREVLVVTLNWNKAVFKRDMRFVPEKHKISRAGLIRVAIVASISVASLVGLVMGGKTLWRSITTDDSHQLMVMEADRTDWKRKPEKSGGRLFLNKGLEINRVQAELFEAPRPEEIVLAPPPEDF